MLQIFETQNYKKREKTENNCKILRKRDKWKNEMVCNEEYLPKCMNELNSKYHQN
jgi:hypothetical protein